MDGIEFQHQRHMHRHRARRLRRGDENFRTINPTFRVKHQGYGQSRRTAALRAAARAITLRHPAWNGRASQFPHAAARRAAVRWREFVNGTLWSAPVFGRSARRTRTSIYNFKKG